MRRPQPAGKARLTLTINNTDYFLINLRPHPETAIAAWRLTKKDGTSYDISITKHGVVNCTCPDFTWSREPYGAFCKHIKAALALGLLPTE